jgi:hypothetical protein
MIGSLRWPRTATFASQCQTLWQRPTFSGLRWISHADGGGLGGGRGEEAKAIYVHNMEDAQNTSVVLIGIMEYFQRCSTLCLAYGSRCFGSMIFHSW